MPDGDQPLIINNLIVDADIDIWPDKYEYNKMAKNQYNLKPVILTTSRLKSQGVTALQSINIAIYVPLLKRQEDSGKKMTTARELLDIARPLSRKAGHQK